MEDFDVTPGVDPHVRTVVDYVEVPLSGAIYDGLDAKLSLEVRDFGQPHRTLVIRTVVDGEPVTTLVRWDTFTDAVDKLRSGMLGEDWDYALMRLQAGGA